MIDDIMVLGTKTYTLASALRDYDLLYILPEFDVVRMSRPEFNGAPPRIYGLPATVKLFDVADVPISPTDATYRLLKERFKKQRPEWVDTHITQKLDGYLENGVCYTDNNGEWNQIVTCGNVLYPTGNVLHLGGILHYEIRQLKVDTYERMVTQLEAYPYLETWSTISTRGYDGRERIPFGHLDGKNVPALLFCKQSVNWIKASRVKVLDRSEAIPNLYYP